MYDTALIVSLMKYCGTRAFLPLRILNQFFLVYKWSHLMHIYSLFILWSKMMFYVAKIASTSFSINSYSCRLWILTLNHSLMISFLSWYRNLRSISNNLLILFFYCWRLCVSIRCDRTFNVQFEHSVRLLQLLCNCPL